MALLSVVGNKFFDVADISPFHHSVEMIDDDRCCWASVGEIPLLLQDEEVFGLEKLIDICIQECISTVAGTKHPDLLPS